MPLTGQASRLYTSYNDINMAKASTEPGHKHTHTQGRLGSLSTPREMSMQSMLEMNAAGQKYTYSKINTNAHTDVTATPFKSNQLRS